MGSFTPRNVARTERYEMELSDSDQKRFDDSTGPLVIQNQLTGECWTVERAECGLGCRCDAVVIEECDAELV